jgi:electron transport complex protein RnfD
MFSQYGFLENTVRPFLNDHVFSLLRIQIPPYYLNLLFSTEPGIIADRGMLALLAGFILIIAFKTNRAWIPAVWLTVFIFVTRMASALFYGGEWWTGDVLFTLLTGGTLVTAFILACDPATNAKSNWCILAATITGSLLAWLFRFPGSESYGAIFSIVLINALLPIVRGMENRWLYNNRNQLSKVSGTQPSGRRTS